MPTWEELFASGQMIESNPQHEVLKFAGDLERAFEDRPIKIWDLCCGAGRHTKALAERGFEIYASDESESGLSITKSLIEHDRLHAHFANADMTNNPWGDERFHGVVCWDALHHNTVDNIKKAVETVYESLHPHGEFLLTLKSTKADSCGKGREIEPGTYVQDEGHESGVPHHFFKESEVRELFKGWELLVLVDLVMDYKVRGDGFLDRNPFAYTRWGILARRGEWI